jgi:hypothetical protein
MIIKRICRTQSNASKKSFDLGQKRVSADLNQEIEVLAKSRVQLRREQEIKSSTHDTFGDKFFFFESFSPPSEIVGLNACDKFSLKILQVEGNR